MAYSNPAFAAMGIKSFKLPSRNWLIFWSVAGTLTGGIIYDKWRQRVLRDEYMKEFFKLGNQEFPINERPRRLRIYVAPPPNDYLDESLKYLRRFVKPILNSSGIDFQIVTMEKQGDIRFRVAQEIRDLRKSIIERESSKKDQAETATNTNTVSLDEGNVNSIKSVKELYQPMDVIGLAKIKDFEELKDKVTYQDGLVEDVRLAGGIICIGRGAYKEYINGVHEGLLGPLEEPERPKDAKIEELDIPNDNVKEAKVEKDEVEEEENIYAPPPFIYPNEYRDCQMAKEFGLDSVDFNNENQMSQAISKLRDEKTGIPFFFLQPVLELRNYNVAGFTRQPERIWRFYNKRNQLIEYNEKLIRLIKGEYCPFDEDKLYAGVEEENDWPTSWLKRAKENNSEWVREFQGDARVLKLLSSYNCDCNDKKD